MKETGAQFDFDLLRRLGGWPCFVGAASARRTGASRISGFLLGQVGRAKRQQAARTPKVPSARDQVSG